MIIKPGIHVLEDSAVSEVLPDGDILVGTLKGNGSFKKKIKKLWSECHARNKLALRIESSSMRNLIRIIYFHKKGNIPNLQNI